jgi:uncharacterized protein (TIGR03437 family)
MRCISTLIGIGLGFLNTNVCVGQYVISTVAGSDWVGDNGPATLAILKQSEGIASDAAGNLYIADAANHRIRRVTRAGMISTYAGTGVAGFSGDDGSAVQLNSPYGLAMDGLGNLYVADLGNARVRKIAADGTIVTIAGGGSLAPGGANDGSPATMMAFNSPRNLALDGRGALYFSDFGGHRLYRVDLTDGSLTTVAGTGFSGVPSENVLATNAPLAFPTALAVDRNGILYVADSQNHAIRKIVNGVISTVAHAVTPTGIVIDGFATLYVADPAAGQVIAFPLNGKPAVYPISALDLTFGADGYLYASQGRTVIRVAYAGASAVIAGGGSLASGDNAAAANALLQSPSGVAADSFRNIYIADRDNHRIRRIATDGTITTVAGNGVAGNGGDGAAATQAQLSSPSSVTVDTFGNLYITDAGNHRIRQVNPVGIILPVPFPGVHSPTYAWTDTAGNIYVADSGNAANTGAILRRSPVGEVTTLASHLNSPGGFALDASGNLYFTETKPKRVRKLDSKGALTNIAEGLWSAPTDVVVGTSNDLFVTDAGLACVVRVDEQSNVTIVAGTGFSGFSGDGGDAALAQLNGPASLTIDPTGAIFVADLGNNRIRRVTPSSAAIAVPVRSITAVNAASQQSSPIAPGMLVDLLGTGLVAGDQPNIQILFQTDSASIAAQILTVDSKHVEARAPAELPSTGNVTIQILNSSSNVTAQIPASLASASPGVFADASGQALAANEDGTLNSVASPAPRGSIVVFYGTGEGVSGQTIAVDIAGYTASILYAGPVAGFPGLLQVNARMPAGYIGVGAFAVTLHVGDSTSQPGVMVNLN